MLGEYEMADIDAGNSHTVEIADIAEVLQLVEEDLAGCVRLDAAGAERADDLLSGSFARQAGVVLGVAAAVLHVDGAACLIGAFRLQCGLADGLHRYGGEADADVSRRAAQAAEGIFFSFMTVPPSNVFTADPAPIPWNAGSCFLLYHLLDPKRPVSNDRQRRFFRLWLTAAAGAVFEGYFVLT